MNSKTTRMDCNNNNIKNFIDRMSGNKFTQWSQLIMCDKIKSNEKIVLMVILNCNNMGWSYIAHSEIMRQSGLSESTIKRVLNHLKNIGLINEVKSDVNNMNNYIVSGFNLNGLMGNASINEAETDTSGFNLNGLMENEPYKNSQVGSNLTASGFNLTYKNKRNKKIEKKKEKEIYKKKEKRKVITNNPINGNPSNNSHCFSFSVSGCDNPKTLQIQASGRHNTNIGDNPNKAVSHNTNEARPTTAGQNENINTHRDEQKPTETTEIAQRDVIGAQIDNYPTTTEKTQQEANKWVNRKCDSPNDGGHITIDQLEDIYNGGNTIPKHQFKPTATPTENKIRYISIEGWKETMSKIQTKVETNRKLDQTDLHALLEGSDDPFRVIETLKTLKMLLRNYVRLACYWRFLDECEATISQIRSDKQRKYAKDLLSECDKYYDHYRDVFKKAC